MFLLWCMGQLGSGGFRRGLRDFVEVVNGWGIERMESELGIK